MEIKIPKQLRRPEFRFIKLRGKIPIEKNWQNQNNYAFDDSKLLEHIGGDNNYGIVGGYGNLRILDIDDSFLAKDIEKKVNTFVVKTGGGGRHFYFIVEDKITNRVLINDKGELRASNYQVVGATCIHPNGKRYEVVNDVPIKEVTGKFVLDLIRPYLREETPTISTTKTDKKQDTSRSGLEFRRVISLLREGKSKEQIFQSMTAYAKWATAPEQYKSLTYEKAKAFVEGEREGKGQEATEATPERLIILKNPDLLEVINKEFDKTIVEEVDTRKTAFLICEGGSLVENAEPTSTNIMLNDIAGAGKDYIAHQVLNILPKENVIKRKRIGEKTFTYWHNAKFEPDWSWDGKIFYNEDISNSVLNCDVFKVMSSSDGENISTILINQTPIDILIRGKPIMILTSASPDPTPELIRRYPCCDLNTSQDQTNRILKSKAEYHKKGIRPIYDERITNALRLLKRVKVKVPFADRLVDVLSTQNIAIRTHFDRFIDYIKFSTAIHQYQREKDEEGYYIAEKQDYDIARVAMIKTTSNIFSISLTKNQQKILEILKDLPEQEVKVSGEYIGGDRTLIKIETKAYSVADLEPKIVFISDRTLRTELDKLTYYGFLSKDKQERFNSKRPVMVYTYLAYSKIDIPLWKDIPKASNHSGVTNDSFKSNVSNDRTNETNETKEAHPQGKEMPKWKGKEEWEKKNPLPKEKPVKSSRRKRK